MMGKEENFKEEKETNTFQSFWSSLIVILVMIFSSINYVSSVVESVKHKDRGKSDLVIYIRIFCVLGFTWIFGVFSFFFK